MSPFLWYPGKVDQPFQVPTRTRVLPGWSIGIRPISAEDHDEIVDFLTYHWGSPEIVSLNQVLNASELDGYLAPTPAGDLNGLVTLHTDHRGTEIVTMNSIHRGRGIGTNLMSCAEIYAREAGSKRLWLVTTNDNVEAMSFYMSRSFRMVKVHQGSVDRARLLKSNIPDIGHRGIEIHDQVEFELVLK
jgi:DNA-3-methyladenine glycosylase I